MPITKKGGFLIMLFPNLRALSCGAVGIAKAVKDANDVKANKDQKNKKT